MKQEVNKKIPASDFQDSEVYDPYKSNSNQEEDSYRHYRRRIEKFTSQSIEGKWTQEQNLKYILFMEHHSKIFASKEKRKSTRIFKSLSAFLKTRTPRQCRSHFQKIIGKFKTVKKVKQYYQEQLGPLNYEEKYSQLVDQLQSETVKTESKEQERQLKSTMNVETQTEPMKVSLSDLANEDVMELMNMMDRIRSSQYPFWMPPILPQSNIPFLK